MQSTFCIRIFTGRVLVKSSRFHYIVGTKVKTNEPHHDDFSSLKTTSDYSDHNDNLILVLPSLPSWNIVVVVIIIFFRFAQYPPPSLLRSDFNYLLFRSRRCFAGNKNIIMLFNSASIKRESFCKITSEKREQKMFLPDVNKLRIASSAPQELWERCLVQCSCQKSIAVQHIFYEISLERFHEDATHSFLNFSHRDTPCTHTPTHALAGKHAHYTNIHAHSHTGKHAHTFTYMHTPSYKRARAHTHMHRILTHASTQLNMHTCFALLWRLCHQSPFVTMTKGCDPMLFLLAQQNVAAAASCRVL